jgi:preprotein translocase subunit YajC
MNIVPLLVIGALLLVMVFFSNRSKAKRAAADVERRKAMVVGTHVMTTSGMHGTITAVDPENDGGQADTVTLEIAPGVEVVWALAAVREAPQRIAAPAIESTETGTAPEVTDPTADTPPVGPVRMVKPKGRTGER